MNIQVHTLDWKYVLGYDQKYLLNKTGVLVSLGANGSLKLIKPRTDRAGYQTVRISKAGKTSTNFLHRLIAVSFIPNAENKTHVNHKNGKKSDNWFENLEWVTHAENIKHAYVSGLINKSKPVIDTCTGKIFKSTKEASLYLGINQNTLKGYLNGTIKKNPTTLAYKPAA